MNLRILFDTTRLAWRAQRHSPTGIDRVLLAYAEWLLAETSISLQPVALAGQRLVPVSREALQDLVARTQAQGGEHSSQIWCDLMEALALRPGARSVVRRPIEAQSLSGWLPLGLDVALRALKGAFQPSPQGDVYLNVAHTGLHHPSLLSNLAKRGVRPVVMVHDLIPITHPEYCTPAAGARHLQRIDHVVDHAALVIANSQATADDLQHYARRTGRSAPPIEVVHLGLAEAFLRPTSPPADTVPYFVCVGTIEARKNLAFLLAVWRRLAETLGGQAPHLVIVGRRGWENEAVIDHLERSPPLHSVVHEVADLSDDQLARLMAGARALLAPSFVEGFDLPVMEALAIGTPVIASDIAVHRELASTARLVDPLDGKGWATAVMEACDADLRATQIAAPIWPTHFERIERALRQLTDPAGARL